MQRKNGAGRAATPLEPRRRKPPRGRHSPGARLYWEQQGLDGGKGSASSDRASSDRASRDRASRHRASRDQASSDRRRRFGRPRAKATVAVVAVLAVAAGGVAYALVRETTRAPALPPRADPGSPARIVLAGQDAPSPFIMVEKGTYYLYSSSWGYSPNLPVRTSRDLTSWSAPVETFPRLPPWAVGGVTWDPAVYRIDGRYLLYFSDQITFRSDTKCIGVASATGPLGPFHGTTTPFICQLNHRGSIDPRVFTDADGTRWLIWKSDDNADVPGTEHTTIWSQRLAPDGMSLVGPRLRILHADQPWEGRIVESPQMVTADGQDWLFFSGNWFNQPRYAIGVASCAGPAGPCTNPSRPLITSNSEGKGPGEPSLFVDNGQVILAYTPSYASSTPDQPVALAHVAFGPDGPYIAAS